MGIAEENTERAGQLGYGVLKRFQITFDYSRSQAFFKPNASFHDTFEFDHAGFILGAGGRQLSTLTVFMVIAGTPAADAGIQQGDEILAIDGRAANTFTLDEARTYFEHILGVRTLTIRRDGSILTVTLACRRII
jgi:S1-C subfamily serine protease